MKKERSILKLLVFLRDYIRDTDRFFNGMCLIIMRMNNQNLISLDERVLLIRYFEENKPKHIKTSYWWKVGDKVPRLKWLNKQIKKLSKQ
jgi:hypothetical protein